MLFKILTVALLLIILFSLFRALFIMVAGKSASGATVKALSWRIGLSVCLFLMLVLMKLYFVS
ncbi:DUF2909 domain-containing protein [Pelagibaculum spongiae]|uniref:DUF2909 domain-containing protein n=1 Tax=Pelagibaculum spongiae TaxID=2080658 RepID=A0A2V1H776_9GAMM|nr:DUF2909 domain-containing protein [Pelagibaculum spongiae]